MEDRLSEALWSEVKWRDRVIQGDIGEDRNDRKI